TSSSRTGRCSPVGVLRRPRSMGSPFSPRRIEDRGSRKSKTALDPGSSIFDPQSPLPSAALTANLIARSPLSALRERNVDEPHRGKALARTRRAAVLRGLLRAPTPPAALAQAKRPMQVEDLFRFKRVADPQISPDGKTVVYVLTTVDLENNRSSSNLWVAPVASPGEPRQLTATPKKDRHPRCSPDGRFLLFESNRSGANQLWVIDTTGGEARQLTTIATEASTGLWSRDGKQIAFVSAVYPEYSARPFKESNALNQKRLEAIEKNPVKAKVFTRLFFRHWDEYVGDKRQHLFVMNFDPATVTAGEPRDVTPGDRDAYPTSTTFSVGDDFTFSPDGKYL